MRSRCDGSFPEDDFRPSVGNTAELLGRARSDPIFRPAPASQLCRSLLHTAVCTEGKLPGCKRCALHNQPISGPRELHMPIDSY
jgi:hypothetical protein